MAQKQRSEVKCRHYPVTSIQWCIAKHGGGYTQKGVAYVYMVYPAYLWSLRWVYAVKKTRRLVYGVYPRIPPIHHCFYHSPQDTFLSSYISFRPVVFLVFLWRDKNICKSHELHCFNGHSKINRKMGILTACRIATSQNFILKFGTRDDVWDLAPPANFGADGFGGGSSKCVKHNTFVTFLTVLISFSILSTGQTAAPMHTLNGSNDVFLCKQVPLGG